MVDYAKLKGSKTEANLRAALSGESQARNRYSYFAESARAEGHTVIADFFEHTANNEKAHAKAWFMMLNDGVMPGIVANLESAIKGELFESSDMYPMFAQVAREEGFDKIAALFDDIALIEKKHADQLKEMLATLNGGKPPSFIISDTSCLNCGHDFNLKDNLEKCPVCDRSPAFFVRKG